MKPILAVLNQIGILMDFDDSCSTAADESMALLVILLLILVTSIDCDSCKKFGRKILCDDLCQGIPLKSMSIVYKGTILDWSCLQKDSFVKVG